MRQKYISIFYISEESLTLLFLQIQNYLLFFVYSRVETYEDSVHEELPQKKSYTTRTSIFIRSRQFRESHFSNKCELFFSSYIMILSLIILGKQVISTLTSSMFTSNMLIFSTAFYIYGNTKDWSNTLSFSTYFNVITLCYTVFIVSISLFFILKKLPLTCFY